MDAARLAALTREDAGALAALAAADPSVEEGLGAAFERLGAARWLELCRQRAEAGAEQRFGVRDGSGELVGACGLTRLRERAADVSYWIGGAHRGRGYATAAVAQLLRFGARRLHLRAFHAAVRHDNQASRRVLAKLGFAPLEAAAATGAERRLVVEADALARIAR